MTTFDTAAIIGLGLIGGSLARDLAALGVRVSAYDADKACLAEAQASGTVTTALEPTLEGVLGVDVVILAVPVHAAAGLLRRIAPHVGHAKLITDVGSTKANIVNAAAELGLDDRFVGGHPMAGDHRSGWDASRRGLFADAPVYLCPNDEATIQAVDTAQELWRAVGANPEIVSAAKHDLMLAWTSHLPHMVSTSLALALAWSGVSRATLGPGGRDTTRLAGSSPEMWTGIAVENGRAIATALKQTEREMASLRAALERADPAELRARFTAARAWFDE